MTVSAIGGSWPFLAAMEMAVMAFSLPSPPRKDKNRQEKTINLSSCACAREGVTWIYTKSFSPQQP